MTREEFIYELKSMARDVDSIEKEFNHRADGIRLHDPVLAKMVIGFGRSYAGVSNYARKKLDELGEK